MTERSVGSVKMLGFGMVNIPIRLYTAQREKDLKFHKITEEGNRVRMTSHDAMSGVPTDKSTTQRGYEVAKDRYVIITDEEMDAARPTKNDRVEIDMFVDAEEVSALRFDKTQWIGPDKGAAKSYSVLLNAMKKAGKVGICTGFVSRGKENLAVVQVFGSALALTTLFWHDEIIDAEAQGIAPKGESVSKPELAMALQLIEAQGGTFKPEAYHDRMREKLLKIIETKAGGGTFVAEQVAEPQTEVMSLMDALAASVKAARKSTAAKPKRIAPIQKVAARRKSA